HQLRTADGREAPDGSAMGALLRRLPGARREGDAPAVLASTALKFLCSLGPSPECRRGPLSSSRPALPRPPGAGEAVLADKLPPVPRAVFSEKAVPAFEDAPSVVLVTGDVEFFVEEAAGRAREALAGGGEAEVLRFEDDAPADTVSDALLNRSLFSPRRIVELDVSRLLGTESPGKLLEAAVEAWDR